MVSLHLTRDEWDRIAADGRGVLFREGEPCRNASACLRAVNWHNVGGPEPECECEDRQSIDLPPAEFVEAAQACETCGGEGKDRTPCSCGLCDIYYWTDAPCPDCIDAKRRIAAVVPCGTPDEWCDATGIKILDPDGWDRSNFAESWSKVIDRHEFMQRMGRSTVIIEQPRELPDGITVGHVVVTWGPLVVVEKPPPSRSPIGSSGKSVFVHGGDLWFSSMQPHTTSPFITSLPPDVDPQSLIGQYAIGVEVAG